MSLLLRNALVGGARTSVLVEGSTIAAVGDELEGGERVELDGAELRPGFVDTHTHLGWAGAALWRVDWSGGCALDEVRRARARMPDGYWLLGGGFSREAELPAREALDEASAGAPAFLASDDGSVGLVNSRAAEIMLAETPDGRVDGRSRNTAGVVPPPDRHRARAELATALAELPRHGITEVHDIATYPGEPEPPLRYWERSFTDATLYDELELPVRVRVRPSLHRRREFSVGGRVHGLKLFAGVSFRYPGSETARRWIREAHDAGVPVSVHALYADDVAETLDLFDGLDGVPHRLVHAYEVHDADVPRIARSGLTVEAQPWDTVEAVGAGPWRKLLDAGAAVEFGSDWRDANLDAVDPLVGAGLAVEHGLTREEALDCYSRGPVAPGAPADLVAVQDGEVVLTICDGRETFRR